MSARARAFGLGMVGVLALFGAGGCLETTPVPDHRIRLMETADGKHVVPVPPECASWHEYGLGGWQENAQWPTYGCASARNLAAHVERPEDLIAPHELGPADGVVTGRSVERYRAGKTKALIDPNAEAPTAENPSAAGDLQNK